MTGYNAENYSINKIVNDAYCCFRRIMRELPCDWMKEGIFSLSSDGLRSTQVFSLFKYSKSCLLFSGEKTAMILLKSTESGVGEWGGEESVYWKGGEYG